MIRSAPLQRALYFGAKYLDQGLWRVFHEGVRRFYLGPVRLFLGYWLRPKAMGSKDFRLIVRHSATIGSDFSAFLSDLDLSVIIADSKISHAAAVVQLFQKWKSRLPFIGELEIYSGSEFEELSIVSEKSADIYPVIRRIRKLSWMEHACKDASSAYHQLKAKRSVSKILSKDDIDHEIHSADYRALFSERIKNRLNDVFSSATVNRAQMSSAHLATDFTFVSDYLATTLVNKNEHGVNGGEILLPTSHCLLLLALLPRKSFGSLELNEAIERIRRDKGVHEKWMRVSRIECLVFRAVLRAQSSISDADRDWLKAFVDSWELAKSKEALELA